MTKFSTGAERDTGGKGRCDLLPHSALLRVSRQMEGALAEHEERNWEKGIPMHSFLDSAMRHLFKYMDGQADEDHLAAAATNVLMALWTEDHLPEMQDIPTRRPKAVPDLIPRIMAPGDRMRVIREEVSDIVSECAHADPDGGGDSDLFRINPMSEPIADSQRAQEIVSHGSAHRQDLAKGAK